MRETIGLYTFHMPVLLAFMLLMQGFAPADAQVALPEQTTPGAQLQDLQREIPETDRDRRTPQKPRDTEKEEPVIRDETPEDGAEAAPPARKYYIRVIEVRDMTVLDDQTVAETIESYENRELGFDDLQQLARELTALYRAEGYVTSRVFIPPQKILEGQVYLQAAEGTIGEIIFEKDEYFPAYAVLPRIELERGGLLNLNSLPGDLRRINENPDLTVRAILRPGAGVHETDVVIQAEDKVPIHPTLFYDNITREFLGNHRLGVKLENNNLLGLADRNTTLISFTTGTAGIVNHYELPIGHYGTKIGFDYSHSRLMLEGEFADLDVRGRATAYAPFISQSLINEKNLRADMDFSFNYKDIKTTVLGEKFSEDKLRFFTTGINVEETDEWGRTFLRNEVSLGMGILNATTGFDPFSSRFKAGSRFFRYITSVTRLNRLPLNSYAIVRGIGQWTPDRLVSAEQFQAGGTYSVRGYREGALIGDKGFIFSVETRSPFFLFPESWKLPFTQYKLRENVQLVSFADFGGIFINRSGPNQEASDYILGVGMGVRARLTRHLNGRFDVGFPLLRLGDRRNDPRIHFGLKTIIF